MVNEEVVILSGVRTAIGRFGRAFKDIPAQRLGAMVIKEAIKRAGIKEHDVEEVIIVNVISGGLGQNPAKQAAIYAGLPVFNKDGILTAGNSSKSSDGAAALVVASARKAKGLGLASPAQIVDYITGGTRPEDVMEAPIPAVKKLLKKTGFTIDEMDLVERNEAYAPAFVVVARELGIDPRKFNVNGGAVAMGHPIGCSGAIIIER